MKRPCRRRISLVPIVVQLLFGATIAILVGWFFRTTSYDFMQQDSDAAYFFELASAGDFDFKLDASVFVEENTLPLSLYSSVYRMMSQLGIHADPLWGIMLNALLVVSSQLIAVVFAHRVFGCTNRQLAGLAALLALNGLLMLFAGIHMRDAFLLFTTTTSIFLFRPLVESTLGSKLWRFAALILLMGISFLCRREGFVVPLIVYVVALGVKQMGGGASRAKVLVIVVAALGGTAVAIAAGLLDMAIDNYAAYRLLSQVESSDSSLAYLLLYDLPFPISTIASATFLLFIKFPFWRGMLLDAYGFFMSIASVQMLFIAPAFIAIVFRAFLRKVGGDVYYLVLVLLCLLFMTAVTSSQVRHFAIGYPFLILLYHVRQQVIGTRGQYVRIQHFIFGVAGLLSITVGFR
jgi:hypothetical protein